MSGEGPDSVPTSADPRSHRPTKKRALSPTSSQAASVSALFARPDAAPLIPELSSAVAARRAAAAGSGAPEIVANVQGSSAGAGSGEFHVYKAARRREYERLRAMDDEVRAEKASEEFEREKAEREARDAERTRKNREKRDKKKKRKGPAGGAAPAPKVARREIGEREKGGEEDGNGEAPREVDEGQADGAVEGVPAAGLVIHDDD